MPKALSITDQKIVKAHLDGKNSKQIAAEVMPDKISGASMVRQRLQKLTLKDAVNAELLKQGLTLAQVIAPITKALNAKVKKVERIGELITDNGDGSKSVEYEYKEIEEDNIPLQLQGSDRAAKLMGLDRMHDTDTDTPPLDEEDLKALSDAADEVELTRILFKKNKA